MVVTGTDAVGGSSPNLHVELQLLVQRADFTPLEAIRAATFDAARVLGLAGEVGSLAAGRRADLVVMARNPAEDIRNSQTVLMVMRGGVVHERADPMPVPPLAEGPRR
jgi:imidazolonepropionase-like amidohydrolase